MFLKQYFFPYNGENTQQFWHLVCNGSLFPSSIFMKSEDMDGSLVSGN